MMLIGHVCAGLFARELTKVLGSTSVDRSSSSGVRRPLPRRDVGARAAGGLYRHS